VLTPPKNEGSAAPVIQALCTLRPHSDTCRPLQVLAVEGTRLVDCAQNTPFVESEGAIVRGGRLEINPCEGNRRDGPKVSGADRRRQGD
jgi:hypothetical protein